jgi:hypothetical protein
MPVGEADPIGVLDNAGVAAFQGMVSTDPACGNAEPHLDGRQAPVSHQCEQPIRNRAWLQDQEVTEKRMP